MSSPLSNKNIFFRVAQRRYQKIDLLLVKPLICLALTLDKTSVAIKQEAVELKNCLDD